MQLLKAFMSMSSPLSSAWLTPRNLLRVIEDGIGEQKFAGFEHMQPMPGFADKLKPEQLTDLLNYLRQGWGGQSAELAVSDVQKLQADAPAVEHKAH